MHTAEISTCAGVPAKEIPRLYAEAGYRYIVVTDHWNEYTLSQFPGNTKQKNEKWLDGYKMVREGGEKLGLTVLLGVELTVPSGPEDFLLYGFTEAFMREYPRLHRENLATVYQAADKAGLLVVQAHPFRPHLKPADPRFLHGAEVFNGNPRHENNNDKALAFAQKHGLVQTAGSDFHQYEDIDRGGAFLPAGITDSTQLAECLRKGDYQLYQNE